MAQSMHPNLSSNGSPPPPPPPPPSLSLPPPPPPSPCCGGAVAAGSSAAARRPPIRVTSEFDSESAVFFHKVSCKVLDGLAKLKLSFQNDRLGQVACPQLGLLTKHFSVLYDLESRNALLKGSFDLANNLLRVCATHDVKNTQIGEPDYVHLGLTKDSLSVSCTCENMKSIISHIKFGNIVLFKYHRKKEQQGEVSVVTSLGDPSYKLELALPVPSIALPRATLQFPLGEISVEQRREEESEKFLSFGGILKGPMLNGICTALYKDDDLNLRYCFKDQNMAFIPSVTLPSNALSFAFKRRFRPSDKLSYWYHFDSNEWSAVYKHTAGKDLKFKAGYDSGVRLGWASLWVGDEGGKAKAAPMKMKVQFMLQVPQDDIRNSVFMFRLKKRWDF